MKKNIMKKWVEALRSTKYTKGRGVLCEMKDNGNKTFCCLGVLCDLYQQDRVKKKKKKLVVRENNGYLECKRFMYDGKKYYLPTSVRIWAGMRTRDGKIKDSFKSLAQMNDIEGKSFNKIADIIEAKWEIL